MATNAEIKFWKLYFNQINTVNRNIPDRIQNAASIQELREIKGNLNAWKPQILEIRSTLETVQNIESIQQRHNIKLANEAVFDIENWTSTLYDVINEDLIQLSINAVITKSINIFRKKCKPLHNKINRIHDKFEVTFLNSNKLKLLKKFDSIDINATDKINTANKEAQVFIAEKLYMAKSKNQIYKIFREIKEFIKEEIDYAVTLHQSALSKFKILRKSVKKSNDSKKVVVLKNRNQTNNEFSTLIYIKPLFLPYAITVKSPFSFIAKLFVLSLEEVRFSLNFDWKYFRKKKKKEKLSSPKLNYYMENHLAH